jgi:glucose/arabinose dehydrogenase
MSKTLPKYLVVREYVWEKVNRQLFRRLIDMTGSEAPHFFRNIQNIQQEKKNILKGILQFFRLSPPDFPKELVHYPMHKRSLLKELVDREKELKWVYESYAFFLPKMEHQLIKRLGILQNEILDLLLNLEKRLQKNSDHDVYTSNDQDYWLHEGYELQLVVSGLTFPTSLVFDDEGELYVAEAGYSYGPAAAKARILHVKKSGEIREVASGFDRPLTGFAWHEGYFYAATGDFNGKIYRVSKEGEKKVLIEGLRGGADHYTTELVFGPDGKMYFGVGTVTNSSVVGMDNFLMGWLGRNSDYHDVPARDLMLIGRNYKTPNFLTKKKPNDKAVTGAFHPFGVPSVPGEIIPGQLLSNGVIYRANPDGSDLEIVADGFRNPFGLGFSSDGRLFATSNGYDFRGSRPIEGDWDPFYEVIPGWYGFPDFPSGLPVTLPYFKPPGHPQPEFVLAKPPPIAAQPLIRFTPHAATQKFDFCTNEIFSSTNDIFFAQFGRSITDDWFDFRA